MISNTRENAVNFDPVFYAYWFPTYPGYLVLVKLKVRPVGGSLGSRMWFDGKGLDGYPDWAVKNATLLGLGDHRAENPPWKETK